MDHDVARARVAELAGGRARRGPPELGLGRRAAGAGRGRLGLRLHLRELLVLELEQPAHVAQVALELRDALVGFPDGLVERGGVVGARRGAAAGRVGTRQAKRVPRLGGRGGARRRRRGDRARRARSGGRAPGGHALGELLPIRIVLAHLRRHGLVGRLRAHRRGRLRVGNREGLARAHEVDVALDERRFVRAQQRDQHLAQRDPLDRVRARDSGERVAALHRVGAGRRGGRRGRFRRGGARRRERDRLRGRRGRRLGGRWRGRGDRGRRHRPRRIEQEGVGAPHRRAGRAELDHDVDVRAVQRGAARELDHLAALGAALDGQAHVLQLGKVGESGASVGARRREPGGERAGRLARLGLDLDLGLERLTLRGMDGELPELHRGRGQRDGEHRSHQRHLQHAHQQRPDPPDRSRDFARARRPSPACPAPR
ncbi:MAG: hypothetical protein M5U08_02260 [Burkholderiales bacterium]|nr:hypothetical protein [Burkholderiales bacterium]